MEPGVAIASYSHMGFHDAKALKEAADIKVFLNLGVRNMAWATLVHMWPRKLHKIS